MDPKSLAARVLPRPVRHALGGIRGRLRLTPAQFDLAHHGRVLSADEQRVLDQMRSSADRTCPICGYHGPFRGAGQPIRRDAQCPECGSLERHRLFWLWLSRRTDPLPLPVLHFAAEPFLETKLRERYGSDYRTADLFAPGMDLTLDLEDIDLPDASQGTVLASHVLEHVDDAKTLGELHRILEPGGLLLCGVPLIESWATSYEDPTITSPEERELHFGQSDHVRYYGRDFRDRVVAAGFEPVEEVSGTPEECVQYSLIRGEILFVYRRPLG